MSIMATEAQILPEIEEDVTEPDGMAHYVRIASLGPGQAVVALCGKKYIPTIVGQEVFDKDVCPPCDALFKLIQSMDPPE